MRTSIILDRLRFYAFHGVEEQERRVGNIFTVSLRLDYPFEEAMATDRLTATLNYAEAYEVVKQEMAIPSRLLEHVAGRIRRSLLLRFPQISGGRIRVEKLRPPIPGCDGTAAVEIDW